MITKSTRNKIKKVLGNYYSQIVLDDLNNRGIKNKYGLPHTNSSTIINVMNGQAHSEIEKSIWNVYEEKKIELLAEEERKKQILSA